MKYRFLSILLLFTICSCDQLQEVVNQMPQPGPVGNDEIVMGLRQALEFGVDKQVTKLTEEDGFFGRLPKIIQWV